MMSIPPLREWDGAMTRELLREPGRFGLGQLPTSLKPVSVAKAICGFCATGCGLKVHLDSQGQAINVTPDPEYPVNLGMACPKGWEALTPLWSDDRGTTPMVSGKAVGWGEALGVFCDRFKEVQAKHGARSTAFLSTGQIMVEEMAFLGSLAKFGMGMIHGDGNTRQCMATAVTAYKQSFGFDAPPFTYADFEESDVLVFVGGNPAIAHPIMWQRVERNRNDPEIIVIDPRMTETAMAGTLHVPIAPKMDIVLLYCLAHEMLKRGVVDREFVEKSTAGFEAFCEFLEDYEPSKHLLMMGLTMEVFERCADLIAKGKRVSMWWTMGVNQGHQATRTAQAIINLCLMTGNIGRPGTGPNSITGQCNAMGSRLFSNTTCLLGGHDFTKDEDRMKVAGVLGIPEERIPKENSWAYDQIIQGIHDGKIKGLWMIATNPGHSWINQKSFTDAVKKLEFFVVQDMYSNTETAKLAHLYLPAAAWGEKDGTFINAERRFGVSRKVSKAPGQALADFSIFRLIADGWGCGEMFREWTSPEAVFRLMTRVSRGQPCDISGIEGFDMLEVCGGIQWPLAESGPKRDAKRTERRLFEDGRFYTPTGKANFIFEEPKGLPEVPDEHFPLLLITGRGSSAQWHTETRTKKSAVLRKLHADRLLVDMNSEDLVVQGLADGDRVRVVSKRGEVEAWVRETSAMRRGQVFLPMHDPDVNKVTLGVFDPESRQPGYKACAVKVEKVS